jgi:serine/threonine protein phosphatase PrpC
MADHKLRLVSTVLSDIGYVRANNQDSGFAGSRIIAMADGMGGHAGGDTASTIAIRTLAHIERSEHRGSVLSLAETLEKSILAAHDAIVGRAAKEQSLSGMGTTVDTVSLTRGWWVIAHIGDSRAYLLRDGHLIRVTKDHSYVQHLIDTGRITPEEGRNHPQKNVVMRVLGDFDIDPHPDISIRKAQPGDRWLLCSDGLCGPLEDSTIREIMMSYPDREQCAQKLVNASLKAGNTDNLTAVIGDAQIAPAEHWNLINPNAGLQVPLVAGAAINGIHSIADVVHRPVAAAPKLRNEASPAQKAALLMGRDVAVDSSDSNSADHTASHTAAARESQSSRASQTDKNEKSQAQLSPEQGEADTTTETSNTQTENAGNAPVSSDSVSEKDTTIGDNLQLIRPVHADDKADDSMPDTSEIPIVQKSNGTVTADPSDPDVRHAANQRKQEQVEEQKSKHQHHIRLIIRWSIGILIGIVVVAAGLIGAYQWTSRQYFVGDHNGYVTIFRGVPTNVFGIQLSQPIHRSTTKISSLPKDWRTQLQQGISASSQQDALRHLAQIQHQASQTAQQQKQLKNQHPSHKKQTKQENHTDQKNAEKGTTQQKDAKKADQK